MRSTTALGVLCVFASLLGATSCRVKATTTASAVNPAPAPDGPIASAVTTSSSAAAVVVPEGLLPAANGDDVLEEALAWNSAKYAVPSSKFRAGGVHPRKVDTDTVSKVGGGFKVRFASGTQVTTPAVYDGLLFVSGGFSSKELYAFDARTGKPAWAIDLDDDGPSAPACTDGVCVVNTESCTLFVVEAKTGKLVWSKWLGDPLMSAAAIAGGKVFASYPVSMLAAAPEGEKAKARPPRATHALIAFDLKTGAVLWQRWIDGDVMSAPVAMDGKVWAATFSGTLYEIDAETGRIASARRSKATSAPVIVAGNVYFSARADKNGRAGEGLVMMDRDSGSGRMTNHKEARYIDRGVQSVTTLSKQGKAEDSSNGFSGGAPVSANAHLAGELVGQDSVSTLQAHQGSRMVSVPGKNVSTMGDEVIGTDAQTGKKLWSVKIAGDAAKEGGFLATPPLAVAGGKAILVGTVGGEVLQIDPADGKIVKRWSVGAPLRAQPIVQDGWIYAGTADGRLIAVDTGDETLTGWSQWGGDAMRSSVAK